MCVSVCVCILSEEEEAGSLPSQSRGFITEAITQGAGRDCWGPGCLLRKWVNQQLQLLTPEGRGVERGQDGEGEERSGGGKEGEE